MEYGNSRLDELPDILSGKPAFIRAALERRDGGWLLRACHVVCGTSPPDWRKAVWEYDGFVFVADELAGSALASALSSDQDQVLAIGSLHATIPMSQESISWRREPSRPRNGRAPLPWPCTEYEVYRQESTNQQLPQGFLVGEDSPSFPDWQVAVRAFFYKDFASDGRYSAPSELARIQVVESEAWIERVRVTPTHLDVRVRGEAYIGTRVEVSGSTMHSWKKVGKTATVRFGLRTGLSDDMWLYLSRDKRWLDYRVLGPRLADTQQDLLAMGITVEVPDDPESELEALLAIGEGASVEFKSILPGKTDDEKRGILKTVAAFANGDGGTIVFGMDPDEVTVVGIEHANDLRLRDRLGDLIHGNVVPTPKFTARSVEIHGKWLLILDVRAGEQKPYGLRFGNKPFEFYIRRGASTYPAMPDDIRSSVAATIQRTAATPGHLQPFR